MDNLHLHCYIGICQIDSCLTFKSLIWVLYLVAIKYPFITPATLSDFSLVFLLLTWKYKFTDLFIIPS